MNKRRISQPEVSAGKSEFAPHRRGTALGSSLNIMCYARNGIALLLSALIAEGGQEIQLVETGDETEPGWVEIAGVEAGPFRPELWQSGEANLLPDIRAPLLEPLPGKFRNIYAPSVVELPEGGWRVFYGAFDGTATGNDRIYSVVTKDFLEFTDRHTVIEHNVFQHVCNVSAVRLPTGSYGMMATAFPDEKGLNKPAFFSSPDGEHWNGTKAPHPAALADIIRIEDDPRHAAADINGMNVLLHEEGKYRLYYSEAGVKQRPVWRASSQDGRNYTFDGMALEGAQNGARVNDVKKLTAGGIDWYLMALHTNRRQTYYSLSTNGLAFPPANELFSSSSDDEAWIVALGWVTASGEGERSSRLLGILYGAGGHSCLCQNRIFARWLQPRLVFKTEDGRRLEGSRSRGPDRQLIALQNLAVARGRLKLYDESGKHLIGTSARLELAAGRVYRMQSLEQKAAESPVTEAVSPRASELRWWKGNLHTHSLWSDGNDFPEMIADWYKRNGYHFLSFTDHNTTHDHLEPISDFYKRRGIAFDEDNADQINLTGGRWIPLKGAGRVQAYEAYLDAFGDDWIERREEEDGALRIRVKPFHEFRNLFDEPGVFMLLKGQEISDRHLTAPIHVNAANLRDYVPPQGGSNVLETLRNNVNAVIEQRKRTGQTMFPHINHPNFGWAITGEELMQVENARFFEVYNGHPNVANYGDDTRPGTERMWDIALTWRLAVLGLEPMYGLATDDSHNYHDISPKAANPGRGWVMVRATHLTPEKIIHAMEAGDFYASTGVVLRDVRRGTDHLAIDIEAEEGVTYVTRFIGTRKGFDATNEPILNPTGIPLRITHRYSDDIGEVLAEVKGAAPRYKFTGDEIYVRAKIISSKPQVNPFAEGDVEVAWTQPLIIH